MTGNFQLEWTSSSIHVTQIKRILEWVEVGHGNMSRAVDVDGGKVYIKIAGNKNWNKRSSKIFSYNKPTKKT